jgi:phytoene synthase
MRSNSPEQFYAAPGDGNACRTMLHGGSRSFLAASLLLPRSIAAPASALYAFCRMADDEIDRGMADGALADVVARFAIPRVLPEALLDGFAWDAEGRDYETLDDLHAYAARVAGTVGAMMAIIMGRRHPDVIARAVDLGIAMQLTNVARDVGEDASAGRLYLPRSWLREAGIDPEEWLARPRFTEALGRVVQRLIAAADGLYQRADGGIARLPRSCRAGILAARLLYAEIGRELERTGFDSVTRRAIVPPWRKARLAAGIPLALAAIKAGPPAHPVEAARFIVEELASESGSQALVTARPARWWNLSAQFAMVIDLFERLDRREKLSAAGATNEPGAGGYG